MNGAVTTYNYPDATSTCGNSFPASISLPISGLSTSNVWDCVGGLATSASDPNGNAVSYTYTNVYSHVGDPFWRLQASTDPLGNNSLYYYSPNSYQPILEFNNNNSIVTTLTSLDGFGRPVLMQTAESPTGTQDDTVVQAYDSFGRPSSTGMPCLATAGNTCVSATTVTAYDALGRVLKRTDGGQPSGYVNYTYSQNDVKQAIGPAPPGENLKQKQLEYDALGRLTSVCELTSLTGYGNCAQTTNYNGYWTTYAYSVNASGYPTMTVTQNAQASSGKQTRVYTYDLLGRLVSEQNPENGTTSYTYDTDSAGNCSGTYNGDLIKLTDAKGNKICYQYDAIHRVTQITYPSGPDSANTPTKTFVYDAATFNGTPMANPEGKMVEAYTGASGSKTTDEFFSYSSRGELTDTWECTPHSGTNGCASVSNYYHVTAGFWANGALNTLSSNISGVPAQTYGVDGMGRTSSVSAATGQNPVTSTVYDLATYQTTVTYGSLDSDIVKFDQNTGRMTKYTLNVGSNADTGTTTWNANGSLATLAISDTVTGTADTQNCSYTRDDLSRVSSVGCVNGATNKWNQNFTYDAFGNITKTVPTGGTGITFQPTYSSSTNWISALPGVTPTTDANGQMTYDGTHNYTWDSEGKMHSVDTTTLTHDALGRMVEKAVGSTYTQIVYGPQGRFATMNGQTLVKAFIPLPGAQAVYTSTGLAYYRHADHLGSSRLATTPSRTMYSSTAYAPFGESYAQQGTTDLSFTGQDQDTISGMHDFLLRKFVPNQGRWLSPDPAGRGAGDPTSPQSWNRYAYVLNNPMSMIDPFGDDGCYSMSAPAQCQIPDWYNADYNGPPPPPSVYLPSSLCCGAPTGPGSLGDPHGGPDASWHLACASTNWGQPGGTCTPYWDSEDLDTLPSFQINIPNQSGQSGPIVEAVPRPPKAKPTNATTSCMTARLAENFLGSNNITTTAVINVAAVYALKRGAAALLPGPGWVYVAVAVGYDLYKVGQSYADCKNGGQSVLEETPADDQPEVQEAPK